MALILKLNRSFNHKGADIPAPYMVVDKILLYDKHNRIIQFSWYIYNSINERSDENMILDSGAITVTQDEFDTYFSILSIKGKTDPFAQCYIYLKAMRDEAGSLIFEKWKSDE